MQQYLLQLVLREFGLQVIEQRSINCTFLPGQRSMAVRLRV